MTNLVSYEDPLGGAPGNPYLDLPSYGATSDAQASGRAVTPTIAPKPVVYRPYRKPTFDAATNTTTVYWELVFSDLRGPAAYNGMLKDVGHGAQPLLDATIPLDRRFALSLQLVPATYTTTLTNGWGSSGPICSRNIYNVTLVAIGSTADKTLLRATPAHSSAGGGTTDHDIATLTYLTYTPGGVVTCLSEINETGARYLIVGKAGAAAQWLSDASEPPTSRGNDHANTGSLWWHVSTPIGELFSAGTTSTLYTRTGGFGAAPTAVAATAVNAGGWGGWLLKLRGAAEPKVYAVEPYGSSTSSVIGTSARTRMLEILADGSDIAVVNSPLFTITVAGPWQDELFMSDGKSAYLFDGERQLQLDWRANLPADTTIEGYRGDERGMYLLTRRWNSGATLYTRQVIYWEAATNQAYPVQIARTDTATILMANGALPWVDSGTAGNGGALLWPVRVTNDMRWHEQWMPPAGFNPWWASDGRPSPLPVGYAMGFEANGTFTGPYLEFDGQQGYEKTVDGIWCGGNINDAGSAATAGYVEISFGGYQATFTADGNHDYPITNYYERQPGRGRFYQGQLAITAYRTTADENYTPQILPITVRGRTFIPGDPPPQDQVKGVSENYRGSGVIPAGPPPPQPRRRRNG